MSPRAIHLLPLLIFYKKNIALIRPLIPLQMLSKVLIWLASLSSLHLKLQVIQQISQKQMRQRLKGSIKYIKCFNELGNSLKIERNEVSSPVKLCRSWNKNERLIKRCKEYYLLYYLSVLFKKEYHYFFSTL